MAIGAPALAAAPAPAPGPLPLGFLVGFEFGQIAAEAFGVHTHTQVTAPYRGAGRQHGVFVMERLLDFAAEELGADRGLAVLSGPSFAAEVAHEMPTAVSIACQDSAETAPSAREITDTLCAVSSSGAS